VPGAISPKVKRPGSEAGHSLPSPSKVENERNCISSLPGATAPICRMHAVRKVRIDMPSNHNDHTAL
jgi:hypothetical protein